MFYAGLIIILLSVGLYIVSSEVFQRMRCSKTVEGKIVDTYVRVEATGNASCRVNYYYPVYEYEVNGRVYHGRPRQCSRLENWFQIGDTEKLNYNPYNPNEMTVCKNVREILTGFAFVVAGLVVLCWYKLH